MASARETRSRHTAREGCGRRNDQRTNQSQPPIRLSGCTRRHLSPSSSISPFPRLSFVRRYHILTRWTQPLVGPAARPFDTTRTAWILFRFVFPPARYPNPLGLRFSCILITGRPPSASARCFRRLIEAKPRAILASSSNGTRCRLRSFPLPFSATHVDCRTSIRDSKFLDASDS